MLDEKELLILSHLRENSRKSMAEISRQTDIPISTVFDKIKKLENILVTKHTSLIDFSKLGFNIKIGVLLKTNKKLGLRNFLINNKNVNLAYRVDKGFDYFIEAIFRDVREFDSFKEQIKIFDIEKINFHPIIEDIKKEGMFSNS